MTPRQAGRKIVDAVISAALEIRDDETQAQNLRDFAQDLLVGALGGMSYAKFPDDPDRDRTKEPA